MAVVKNLMVRAGGDFSGLTKQTRKAQKTLNNFKTDTTKIMKGIRTALTLLGAYKLSSDSVKAYDYQVEQEVKLATVMKQRMNANEEMIQSVKQLTAEQQNIGIIGDEVQLAGAQQLSTFLKTEKALKILIPAMNNLSAQQMGVKATGEGMVGIANMMGKVLDGNVGALRRVGISFSEAEEELIKYGTEEEKAATLAKIITNNVGEMNKALANTPQGRWKRIANQFGDLQEMIGAAISPLRDAFLPVMERAIFLATQAAAKLQMAFSTIAQFLNALFGNKQTQNIEVVTSGVSETEANVSDLGDAYSEAGKKAKGALAGFDEINSISSDSDASGSDTSAITSGLSGSSITPIDFSTNAPEIAPKVQEMADKVKSIINELKNFLTENKDLIISGFAGTGAAVAAFQVPAALSSLKGFFAGLSEILKKIPVQLLIVAAIIGAVVGAFTYFYQTNEKFKGLVDGILDKIKTTAIDLWNNALVPLGNFMATTFRAAIETISNVASYLNRNVIVPLIKVMTWWWNDVLVPIGSVLKDVLAVSFGVLSDVAKSFYINVLVPLAQFITVVLSPIFMILSMLFTDYLMPAVQTAFDGFKMLWEYALQPLFLFLKDNFQPIITTLVEKFTYMWKNVLIPIAKFLAERFVAAFNTAFETIGGVIKGLTTTLSGLIDFIFGIFTQEWSRAWTGVKNIFKGIFDTLYSVVKSPLNSIIRAINIVIDGLNSISFDLPDWIPGVGGKTFGINIPKMPMLANGGITDVNSPFAAVVGDNRTQREVVAPLDDLMGMIATSVGTAMLDVMQNTQQTSQSGDLILNIDGTQFARVISPYVESEKNRKGNTLIIQPR